MAMVNLGNISAVTTQMLGNDLGGVVASGVSTMLQSSGSESLADALNQLEKFFSPQNATALAGGSLASGPAAFSTVPGLTGASTLTAGLTNPFGATQGLQPKMQGLMQGLNQSLGQMLNQMGALGQVASGSGNAALASQFEMVMDQAIKMQLSGTAGDSIKAQALFQQALGMLSGTGASDATGISSLTGNSALGSTASSLSSGSSAGGFTSTGSTGSSASLGGGLDAMMSQAESLLRSDSMESQLAGQRMMQKALRMFELISKLIEKQSEMASKAIAAIK